MSVTAAILLILLPYRMVAEFGALVILWFTLPRARHRLDGVPLAYLLLLGWTALSLMWSVAPESTQVEALKFLLLGIAGVSLGRGFDWDQIAVSVGTATALMCAGAVSYGVINPAVAIYTDGTLRGFFTHGNVTGWVACLGLMCLLHVWVRYRSGTTRVAVLLLATSCVVAAVQAQAATAFLALATAVACYAISRIHVRATPRIRPALWAGGLAAVVLSGGVLVTNVAKFTSAVGRDATLTGRTQIWPRVVHLIEEQPWTGYGIGGPWAPGSPVREWARQQLGEAFIAAHNSYLELGVELGVLGLALFAVALVPALALWARQALSTPTGAFGFALLTFVLVHGVAESSIRIPLEWLVVGALLTWRPAQR